MMYATKIKMQRGCYYSNDLLEIDSIYIEGCAEPMFYEKSEVYDFLKSYPGGIKVNRFPYPDVIPALSKNGEKYVKSSPNEYGWDNLLSLPRE